MSKKIIESKFSRDFPMECVVDLSRVEVGLFGRALKDQEGKEGG